MLVRGYVHQVVISCGSEVIARHKRSYDKGDFIFDPLHCLSLIERKVGGSLERLTIMWSPGCRVGNIAEPSTLKEAALLGGKAPTNTAGTIKAASTMRPTKIPNEIKTHFMADFIRWWAATPCVTHCSVPQRTRLDRGTNSSLPLSNLSRLRISSSRLPGKYNSIEVRMYRDATEDNII